jgi:hypothetical protein
MTKQEIRKHIVMLNSDLNDQAYLRTNGTISQADYDQVKARIQKRIRELKEELAKETKLTKCSIHRMYNNPCIICKEIEHYKLLAKSAESEMKETESWNDRLKEELENEQQEVSDLKVIRNELEQTIKNNNHYIKTNEELLEEKESEIEELSTDLEQALNNANKSYNPEAPLKLSVNDMLMVRGIFAANVFMFNSLEAIDECIINKKDEITKEQLILIKKDLEKEWQRIVDLLSVFMKEFSVTNWNRMKRETQKIVDITAKTMNSRDLGFFMVTKEGEYISQEYKVRPKVEEAVLNCINSSGTNSLTAYSKEQLVKDITKIVEEK